MKGRTLAGYISVLAGCLCLSLLFGFTTLGVQLDNDVYDFLFRIHPPPEMAASSVILGIDERSFQMGTRNVRKIVAEGLEAIEGAGARAVAVDVILAEPDDDAAVDQRLAQAFARTKNLVLAADMIPRKGWERPIEPFARSAAAIGHVHSDPDFYDNVVRHISLEKMDTRSRYWAMALEAYRLAKGAQQITEDPGSIEVSGLRIGGRQSEGRPLLVRYRRPVEAYDSSVPLVTFWELKHDPKAREKLKDKVVFIGVTADSAAQDRHMTPYSFGRPWPGVEINANAFETLARGEFLRPLGNGVAVLFCLLLAAAAGLVFWRWSGWLAYLSGGTMVIVSALAPYLGFRNDIVFPYAAPFASAWLSAGLAAAYQHFVVRRALRRTQEEKERYQKAIHFVVHEMRTPLTAIQGSSELLGRYKLPEEKRSEMAKMINAESKRLARLIQTFLDVERLSEGEMDLKREPFPLREVVEVCLDRVKTLAERKKIGVQCAEIQDATVIGDRELMEYAIYNLLTNAIKYSPAETRVSLYSRVEPGEIRLSVQDQGIGMDEKELKNIFRKFYRTKKAEASGEVGTGIGLSIVEQILTHHGGRIEVASTVGVGSCFTMVVPATVSPRPAEVSRPVQI